MPEVTSLSFAVFFGLVLVCTFLTGRSRRWIPLLAASMLFAACGSLLSVVLLSLFSFWGFGLARLIESSQNPRVRRMLLLCAVGGAIAALYAYRSVSLLGHAIQVSLPARGLIGPESTAVPLGLSYYSLKVVAYLFEVYARRLPSERHLGRFFLYVAVFLELPAGPIDRPQALLQQLEDPQGVDQETARNGLRLILWGLVKKIFVADRLGVYVGQVFLHPREEPWFALAFGTVVFGVQLYCDFSAYSDLAIGLGRLLGLRLQRNFNAPYAARSVSDFWRRWHISLSSWLRDYVFLPLTYKLGRVLDAIHVPSNLVDTTAFSVSVFVTMLLAGLWHGEQTTYLAWGAVLALFMSVSVLTRKARRAIGRRIGFGAHPRLRNSVRILSTLVMTNIAWVFFRASSVADGFFILRRIGEGIAASAGLGPGSVAVGPLRAGPDFARATFGPGQAACLLVFVIIALVESHGVDGEPDFARLDRLPTWVRWSLYATAVLAVLLLGVEEGSGFIYAGF
ncbi:MAG: hypothetical protein LAO05_10450 [Acidobacteriia bacterium]|nr:hypothetical protein [Terriglobia bacterium]